MKWIKKIWEHLDEEMIHEEYNSEKKLKKIVNQHLKNQFKKIKNNIES